MAELPGSFGKYFLCDKIAAGGMADIYLAKLLGPGGFEKQLVIKQISRELGRERQFVELLVAEAKTLVSLSHGNIVPVYELGVVDDTYFIAMEYVDGPTLAELMAALELRGERLEPPAAAYVAGELSKGLDYAHRKGEGVVHRDLSPRNVLLSREGEVKLVDFGLALASDQARRAHTDAVPSGAKPAADAPATALLPAGSFPYMSPEQVRLEPLDARSDLFSLGVLLWEMLAGRRLFARADVDATLSAVLEDTIPAPSEVKPGVPEELDRICMRALARRREQRYQSAGEILASLARFAYSVEPPVTQATLAGLVARVCPPAARRAAASGQAASGASRTAEPARPTPDGEHTRPMARPAGARPRSNTARTFATSAKFDEVLAGATPLLPFPALSDSAARAFPGLPPGERGRTAGQAGSGAAHRRRARRWAAVAVALTAGTMTSLVIALSLDDAGRDRALPGSRPASPVSASGRALDPGSNPGLEPDPKSTADPRPIPPASPVSNSRPDPPPAAVPTLAHRPDPTPVAPAAEREKRRRGQGTLQVGANPWADVFVDGTLLGQAPGSWPVAAGAHAVELRYRDRRRTFRVTVAPGETEALGLVDFTKP